MKANEIIGGILATAGLIASISLIYSGCSEDNLSKTIVGLICLHGAGFTLLELWDMVR